MKALVEVKFDGIVIPDHVPGLGSDPKAEGGRGAGGGRTPGAYRPNPALAYSIGCMQSRLISAQGNKG
jgi:hypothetical protein